MPVMVGFVDKSTTARSLAQSNKPVRSKWTLFLQHFFTLLKVIGKYPFSPHGIGDK